MEKSHERVSQIYSTHSRSFPKLKDRCVSFAYVKSTITYALTQFHTAKLHEGLEYSKTYAISLKYIICYIYFSSILFPIQKHGLYGVDTDATIH